MRPSKLVLALPSLLLLAGAAPGDILERVVAKVNGDIITLSEFENRQLAAVQAARLGSSDKVETFLRENNARILQEAVDDLLLVQRAAELGIKLRPETVKDVIEGIKKENNIASDDALRDQLRREGMSLEDLRRQIEHSFLKRQVLQRELEGKAVVGEDEARADYEARKQDYTQPPSVHLQEILVKGDDAPARAAAIVARARAGEDFAALARADSAAPSRAAGGDLGVLRGGEMNPEIERAAFALSAGAVSDPIPTPEGLRILRVAERSEGSVVPFAEVKAKIQQRLAQGRWEREYDRYIQELRKNAAVDVKVREVPLQLQATPAEAPVFAPAAPSAPAASPDDEFQTTPQDKPEHVAPPKKDEPPPSPPPS